MLLVTSRNQLTYRITIPSQPCGWLLDYKTETLIILDEEKVRVEEVIRDFESIGLDNIIAFAPLQVIQRLDRFESYKEKHRLNYIRI